jgi:hypothetical protein
MPDFSERMGLKPTRSVLQKDSVDDVLRNRLWNLVTESVWGEFSRHYWAGSPGDMFFKRLWNFHYGEPTDHRPNHRDGAIAEVRSRYFNWDWWEVYDFIEFVARNHPNDPRSEFPNSCNRILERDLSAYRFVRNTLVPITSDQELEAIQSAQDLPHTLQPVRVHISAAVNFFADRKAPDYRNSIKESISAVESICSIIVDSRATLGQALKRLEDKGISIHRALKNAFTNLYGYTCDADGIRHGLLDESTLDFEDAKFMLISCSGFVNYLGAKASKAGII